MRASAMVGSGVTRGRRRAPVWRLLVVLAVVSLVIVGLPVMATAGPPLSFTFTGTDVWCETDDAFLGFSIGQQDGEMWFDVFYDEFEVMMIGGGTQEFAFDGTTLSVEVDMYEGFFGPGGEFVGTAVIEATFEPIGEAEGPFFERFRDGNVWVELVSSFQELAVDGSAVLDGYFDFDLSECGASSFTEQVWQTNPNAFNLREEGQVLECALEGGDAFGFLFSEATTADNFLELFVLTSDGMPLFGFAEDYVFTESELFAVVELFDEETGDGPYEGVVEASLEPTGYTFLEDLTFQNGSVKTLVEELAVTGMVTVGDDELEMVDCYSESFSARVHFSNPNGPKPTGKTPVNDTPEGAIALEDRGTTNAQTNGAADAPEAGCVLVFEPEPGEEPFEFPLPIGKTLWYTFEGTGGEVTVDSAGSNFDTILGIYDGEMNQLACEDDVVTETSVTLQAAITMETVEGETYYVQVGGFGFWEEGDELLLGEFGRIRLNLS